MTGIFDLRLRHGVPGCCRPRSTARASSSESNARPKARRGIVEHQFPKEFAPTPRTWDGGSRRASSRCAAIASIDSVRYRRWPATIDYTVVRDSLICRARSRRSGHACSCRRSRRSKWFVPATQGQRGRAVRRLLHHRHDVSGMRHSTRCSRRRALRQAAAVSDSAAQRFKKSWRRKSARAAVQRGDDQRMTRSDANEARADRGPHARQPGRGRPRQGSRWIGCTHGDRRCQGECVQAVHQRCAGAAAA